MTFPNILSLLRLFSAPVIVVLIHTDRLFAALILFSCAALSDFLDGFLARALRQESSLGAYLDPIADKILLLSTVIVLTFQGKIPFWFTGMAVARDCQIILGVLSLHFMRRSFEKTPLLISKVNTVLQIILVLICLSNELFQQHLLYFCALYSTALTTLLSSLSYMLLWRKRLLCP